MAAYHHGNLRAAILASAASVIARDGVGALSLRAVAAELGVSHTAFRRHFGSREGVLNSLAVQGNLVLAERLRTAAAAGEFLDVGVAYVRFALDEPGLFAVMFRSDLLDNNDPELISARSEALAPLRAGVRTLGAADPTAAEVANWAVVHGVATLALTGTLLGALADETALGNQNDQEALGNQNGQEAPPDESALDEQKESIEALARRALSLLHP